MPSVAVDVNATYGEDTASVLSAGFGSGLVPVVASAALYETGPELVHAPALVCYGGGVVVPGAASASASAATAAGAGTLEVGVAAVSAGESASSGMGTISFDTAGAGPAETVSGGAGALALGASGVSGAVTFAGTGAAVLSGARVSAGNVIADGEGELSPGEPVLLPRGAPGRVALTAHPTASVLAWAVPR